MVTQKELRIWMSAAVMLFQKYEPSLSVQSLEYVIMSERNIYERLSSLIRQIGAREDAEELLEWERPVMLLHGAFMDVIVLRQKMILDPKKEDYAYDSFEHMVWIELGRSMVIHANDQPVPGDAVGKEAMTLYSYLYADTEGAFDLLMQEIADQLVLKEPRGKRGSAKVIPFDRDRKPRSGWSESVRALLRQDGVRFWLEFAARGLAADAEDAFNRENGSLEVNHYQLLNDPGCWQELSGGMQLMLSMALYGEMDWNEMLGKDGAVGEGKEMGGAGVLSDRNGGKAAGAEPMFDASGDRRDGLSTGAERKPLAGIYLNVEMLAAYYTMLLMTDSGRFVVEAAERGKLKDYVETSNGTILKRMRPGTVDPGGMSQYTYLTPVLEEIRKLLKEQAGKSDWWKADVTLVEKLGAALMKLRLMKHVEEIEEGKVR